MKAAMIPLACALGCATAAYAQKHAEEPTSTVSGRVFCADTNVEPGTYYVVANQAGYLAPLAAPNEPQAESATPQPVAAQKPPISAPRIYKCSQVCPSVSMSASSAARRSAARCSSTTVAPPLA